MSATTKTATITVKWNTQAIANLTLHTDYSATGVFNGGTAAGKIDTQLNGGAGACTGTDPTNADLTDDFGTPSPDGTKFTDCQYENAVNAIVSTNSTNWNLGVQATAGYVAANGTLCGYANDAGKAFPFPNAAAYAATQTQYGGVATTNTTAGACASSGLLMDGTGTTTNIVNGCTHSFTSASPANLGMDIELVLANNAPTGTTTVTETYTLTAN
jgi:hypothetical protein